jgi:hypothetical protein
VVLATDHQADDELVGVEMPRQHRAVRHDVEHESGNRVGVCVDFVKAETRSNEGLERLVMKNLLHDGVVRDPITRHEAVGEVLEMGCAKTHTRSLSASP